MIPVNHMERMERDNPVKIVSAVILNEDGHLLLLKRSPEKKDYPQQWDTVVGKIEHGESAREALQREIREELGLDIKKDKTFQIIRKLLPQQYHDLGKEWITYLFLCRLHHQKITLNKEHSEYTFAPLDNLIEYKCTKPFLNDIRLLFPK